MGLKSGNWFVPWSSWSQQSLVHILDGKRTSNSYKRGFMFQALIILLLTQKPHPYMEAQE